MVYLGTERRSEPRQLHYQSIEFVAGIEGELLKGTIINSSASGLGLYSFTPLNAGDEVAIKSTLPTVHRRYAVRWGKKLLNDFCMVGLHCKD